MLGPSRRDDVHLGLARRLETFLANISKRIDAGASYESFAPVLEMMCRAYNPGWLLLAQWHLEERTPEGNDRAKEELRRFLEYGPSDAEAAEAWEMLAQACYYTNDRLGEIHAWIELANVCHVPFHKLANTADKLNTFLKELGLEIDKDQKRDLAGRLLSAMAVRREEARSQDLGNMAWLAIHLGQESDARDYVSTGLAMEPRNFHLQRMATRLGI